MNTSTIVNNSVTADDIAEMRPLLIRASAGTGKTYQLTGRLMRILLGGATLDTVIATTFTRKAAGEILTRVLLLLAHAATDKTGQSLDRLRQQTGIEDLTTAQCIAISHALLRDIHRLKILTLDSLFSQLARSFTYEIGVPPGWRLADEIEDALIREAAIDAMLASLRPSEVTSILAQLGKGDTKRSVRTEMLRVVAEGYQVSRGCEESAWDSLQVPALPDEETIQEAISILSQTAVGHKSADKALRDIGGYLDARNWFAIAENSLMQKVIKHVSGLPLSHYNKVLPPEVMKALRVATATAKTHVLGLLRAQTKATASVIAAYQAHVNEIKANARAFSFDDIAYRLAQSLSPVSMNQISNRMDGSIEHLLLDEFQDTSPVQWNVLKPLAATAAETTGGSFFCVGDTKQAIYGWRGGVAEIFDSVCSQIDGVIQREQNISFRSSPVVIDAINTIFSNLNRHPDAAPESDASPEAGSTVAFRRAVTEFSQNFPHHHSAKPELSGYVTIRSSNVDPAQSGTKFPHLRYVAERIADTAKLAPDHSIGVLTRTNVSVAWLIQLLRAKKVDVSQEGGNPLVDSPAVEMVLSALMMAEHPGDKRWAFHVAHSPLAPWLGISKFDQTVQASHKVRRMAEDDGLARTVENLASVIVPQCDEGDALRLRQLVYLAQQYENNRGPRLSDFVNVVHRKRIEKPRPAQVRVMTIHQAKGLEFDVVVLPEVDANLIQPLSGTIGMREKIDEPPKGLLRFLKQDSWPLLPQSWQTCFEEQLEAKFVESLCLMYVALTRPRRWLDVIVQPLKDKQPKCKTVSSLLYHACECECDASQREQMWFESGDPHWFAR